MVKLRAGNSDILFFIIFFIILFVLWWAGGAGNQGNNSRSNRPLFAMPVVLTPTVITNSNHSPSGESSSLASGSETKSFTKDGTEISPFKDQVTISSLGNASSEYQSGREYIVLQANSRNKESISLVGWFLTNGKNRRIVSTSPELRLGVSDRVYIPEGTLVYSPDRPNILSPINLAPGEKVVAVSGKFPSFAKYDIGGSFKNNMCTGYIGKINNDAFTPNLPNACPDPSKEPGIQTVSDECYKFIRGMPRCHTPKFSDYTGRGATREKEKSVDGVTGLDSYCRSFIADHYNYAGCLKYNTLDEAFPGTEWRVYFGRTWEMWAETNEVVTLYDDQGRVVDEKSYGLR